jgi:hypothetical protein
VAVNPDDPIPLLDPAMEAMWDDPTMRFAMMSVVVAAKLYVTRPMPETLAVLESTVALADVHLREWNEEHPGE